MSHTRAELEAMAAVARNAQNTQRIAEALERLATAAEKTAAALQDLERADRPGQPLYRPAPQ